MALAIVLANGVDHCLPVAVDDHRAVAAAGAAGLGRE